MSRPVIIDTDFGGDPGDILALCYALRSPELEVVAIVSADEFEQDHRARIIAGWLKAGGYDLPVFKGRDAGNRDFFVLDRFYEEQPPVKELEEVVPLLEQLAGRGGCYLALGGMSNLACLLDRSREALARLEICAMGGAFHYRKPGQAEHNIRVDLEAARKVFEAELNVRWVLSDHTFVPQLEMRLEHPLYKKICEAASSSAFAGLIKANLELYYGEREPDSHLDDPLTVSALTGDCIRFEPRPVYFNEKGEFILDEEKGRPVLVSAAVDYDCFWHDFRHKLAQL